MTDCWGGAWGDSWGGAWGAASEVQAPAIEAFAAGRLGSTIVERSQRARKVDDVVARNNQIIIAAMLAIISGENAP